MAYKETNFTIGDLNLKRVEFPRHLISKMTLNQTISFEDLLYSFSALSDMEAINHVWHGVLENVIVVSKELTFKTVFNFNQFKFK